MNPLYLCSCRNICFCCCIRWCLKTNDILTYSYEIFNKGNSIIIKLIMTSKLKIKKCYEFHIGCIPWRVFLITDTSCPVAIKLVSRFTETNSRLWVMAASPTSIATVETREQSARVLNWNVSMKELHAKPLKSWILLYITSWPKPFSLR